MSKMIWAIIAVLIVGIAVVGAYNANQEGGSPRSELNGEVDDTVDSPREGVSSGTAETKDLNRNVRENLEEAGNEAENRLNG